MYPRAVVMSSSGSVTWVELIARFFLFKLICARIQEIENVSNLLINNKVSMLRSDELAGDFSLPHFFAFFGSAKNVCSRKKKKHDLLSPSLARIPGDRTPAVK